MREQLSENPMTWLTSSPMPIQASFANGILATFKPGTAKVVKFKGAHKFYRAAGWDAKGQMASAYGSWWADEIELTKLNAKLSQFQNWLPDELLKKALPAHYRAATALCEDWNDMREMFKLVLPHSDEITGLVGIAAAQPQFSSLDPKSKKTPMLPGGAEQVYFKRTPKLNSVNPLWVYSERLW